MHRVLCRQRDLERARIGVADVLGREPDEPARDVERILAGLEHARQPVDGRVGVAVAHRFVQRRNDVVVLLAGLVVEQRAPLDQAGERGRVEAARRRRRRRASARDGLLEQIQRDARVAVGVHRQRRQRRVVGLDPRSRRGRARRPSARAGGSRRCRRRRAAART